MRLYGVHVYSMRFGHASRVDVPLPERPETGVFPDRFRDFNHPCVRGRKVVSITGHGYIFTLPGSNQRIRNDRST